MPSIIELSAGRPMQTHFKTFVGVRDKAELELRYILIRRSGVPCQFQTVSEKKT